MRRLVAKGLKWLGLAGDLHFGWTVFAGLGGSTLLATFVAVALNALTTLPPWALVLFGLSAFLLGIGAFGYLGNRYLTKGAPGLAAPSTPAAPTFSADSRLRDVASFPWGDALGIRVATDALKDLTLAEVALLRRVALEETIPATVCEAILTAAGSADPRLALSRLGTQKFLALEGGEYRLGRWDVAGALEQFTLWLSHDPRLVQAYRTITLNINKKIRVDGSPVVDEWYSPDFRSPKEQESDYGDDH